MAWPIRSIALLAATLLGGCAVTPPAGPSVMAVPAKGKDPAQFQRDDASCRESAWTSIGMSPQDAANQSLANSTALGTVLGAAAGAAIGAATGNPATGAAIGAGSGLFLGGATGINAAQYSGASMQQRYDLAYAQCMVAQGNIAPVVAGGGAPAGVPGYPAYAYPYPYAYGYPYAYPYPYPYPWYWGGPFVGSSFVFVSGHGHHHGHAHGRGGGTHHAMAHR